MENVLCLFLLLTLTKADVSHLSRQYLPPVSKTTIFSSGDGYSSGSAGLSSIIRGQNTNLAKSSTFGSSFLSAPLREYSSSAKAFQETSLKSYVPIAPAAIMPLKPVATSSIIIPPAHAINVQLSAPLTQYVPAEPINPLQPSAQLKEYTPPVKPSAPMKQYIVPAPIVKVPENPVIAVKQYIAPKPVTTVKQYIPPPQAVSVKEYLPSVPVKKYIAPLPPVPVKPVTPVKQYIAPKSVTIVKQYIPSSPAVPVKEYLPSVSVQKYSAVNKATKQEYATKPIIQSLASNCGSRIQQNIGSLTATSSSGDYRVASASGTHYAANGGYVY